MIIQRRKFNFLAPLLFLFFIQLIAGRSLQAEDEREWLVMVYAVTDSYLVDCVTADINEMETVGSDAKMEILLQLDKNDRIPLRYRIKRDSFPGQVTSPVIETLPDLDCGNWQTLFEFFKWSVKQAPAKRIMLVLHGCLGNLGFGAPVFKQKGDKKNNRYFYSSQKANLKRKLNQLKLKREYLKLHENGARYMGIRQMGFALQAMREDLGRPIDIVVLDDSADCSIEKFYEFTEFASHWVASVGFIPADDMPYHSILEIIRTDPYINTSIFSQKIVKAYKNYYTDYCNLPFGFGATLTAVDLQDLAELFQALDELSKLLRRICKSHINRVKILELRSVVLTYLSADNLDLFQFMQGLKKLNLPAVNLKPLCEKIMALIKDKPLAHWGDGRYYKHASGMSITVSNWMGQYDKKKYALLKWSGFSRWNKFLYLLAKEF
ncbi:clostripain-related cysteine peptidase [Candidatus Riflebacteria bacterium]